MTGSNTNSTPSENTKAFKKNSRNIIILILSLINPQTGLACFRDFVDVKKASIPTLHIQTTVSLSREISQKPTSQRRNTITAKYINIPTNGTRIIRENKLLSISGTVPRTDLEQKSATINIISQTTAAQSRLFNSRIV